MKKILLSLLTIATLGVNAQIVNIPDLTLKQCLLDHGSGVVTPGVSTIDTNNDGEIQVSEANAYTDMLYISGGVGPNAGYDITNTTGLEAFTAATDIRILVMSSLTTIDLSSNTAITTLYTVSCTALTNITLPSTSNNVSVRIYSNPILANLDLTPCPNSQFIQVYGNNLNNASSITTAPVNGHLLLYAYSNNMTAIDMSNWSSIQTLEIHDNSLTALDLTGLNNLTNLTASSNNLTSINTAAALNWLQSVEVSNNNFTSLDFSSNTSLYQLNCTNNPSMTSLFLASGNNPNLYYMDATNNANLTCIEVDDPAIAATYAYWQKDATASYNLNCGGPCIVTIPDANFKSYLLGNAAINTNADSEIQCAEAVAFTGAITCQSQSITDLTGLEQFVNITALNCGNNNLGTIDISANTALTQLQASNCQLTALDITNNPNMQYIVCENNPISTIDFSQTPNISSLNLESCPLITVDVSSLTQLTDISVVDCQLTSLNIANGNNPNLAYLYANNNPSLTCIQVDDPALAVTYFDWAKDATASYSSNCSACLVNIPDANFKSYLVGNAAINTNADSEIQCAEASAFTGLIDCSSQTIADLTGIEEFTALTGLICHTNQLTSLDVSTNTTLTELRCQNNQLTSLDVSSNTALTNLNCSNNLLTSMNVSGNTALTELNYNSNQITTADISLNTALTWVGFGANQLTALDVSNNTSLDFLDCSSNQITSLDVSDNSLLTGLYCSGNALTSLNAANGNNINFSLFLATNNPGLTCIEVDDAAWSTTNWTSIDATASFSENCSLGLIENEVIFNISPNPASSSITINTNAKIESITIINALGQKVLTSDNNTEINIEHLTNGVYFVTVKANGELRTQKLIKK